jgi:glycosyltransferase involved in cell wall biosynthesis
MRILTVLPAAPRPFGDTAARWFYVLTKCLLERGHDVVCLVVTQEPEPVLAESRQRLAETTGSGRLIFRAFSPSPTCHPLVRRLRSLVKPFSETYYAEGLREAIAAEMRKGYDILHLEQLWTGWLGTETPRSLLNIHHFEVIDWEDHHLEGLHERKAMVQMTRATHRILRAHERMRVFTPRLLDKARSINSEASYWVVPFALDLSLYPLQPAPDEPVLGLIGSMHWTPSRSAGERLITRIWPLVKKRVPHAKLFIAGWNAREHLGKYLPMPDVTLEDGVAHPKDFFSKASVMVYAPSRGSGMKIKVLESMAYGVPVVTTWEGVEGIEYENGTHCWVEEEDETIAARAAALLEDRPQRERMRQAARSLMEERYSPEPVMGQMLRVYDEVARER